MSTPQKRFDVAAASPSLEKLLNIVAISHVQKGDETLRQLLLHCVVLFPSEHYLNPDSFHSVLGTAFGLDIATQRIQLALDQLCDEKQLLRSSQQEYSLSPRTKERIQARISSSARLQERVKSVWLQQCKTKFGDLDLEKCWRCLQDYLTQLFRQHGLQTVALLDGSIGVEEDQTEKLKSTLDLILNGNCSKQERPQIEACINMFLNTVASDEDRTAFIVQLADGAFGYYALSVPPEVAAQLQASLKELTLFLDTNFLLGLLGLHVNPLDAVSVELIATISKHSLPFKLRYHESTDLEMQRTIIGITSDLRGKHWPPALSRAAAKAPYISSIERRFHEENAKHSIDPETFFKPFEHPDVLLKDRGILLYRTSADRLKERSNLIARYQEFLHSRKREKPYEAIDHDMTVLDCVRQLRSKSTSSLDARALVVTCDGMFSRFDWQQSKKTSQLASTILPNQLLQLLRPFIPSSPDFDKSFAETFCIPEFRTITSTSAAACSKLLSLLATYKDVKEETASALLANELLIDKLSKSVKNDKEFKEFVDAALVAENASLLEEMVALKQEATKDRAVASEKERLRRAEQEALRVKLVDLTSAKESAEARAIEAASELESQSGRINELSGEIQSLRSQAETAQASLRQIRTAGAVVVAVLLSTMSVLGGEIAIRHYRWNWILSHPNSYAIRALCYLGITCFYVGLLIPALRRFFWWGSVGFAVIFLGILSLLGGPSPK